MKLFAALSLSLVMISQSALAQTDERIESIVQKCRAELETEGVGRVASYGLILTEAALLGGALFLVKEKLMTPNPALVGAELGLSATITSAFVMGLEAYRAKALPLGRVDQGQLRSMLAEFSSGTDGLFTQSIHQSCQQANVGRAVPIDCDLVLKHFKEQSLRGEALFCKTDEALAHLQQQLNKK